MNVTQLYVVPIAEIGKLVPDCDFFDESFDSLIIDGLDVGYWELFARGLAKRGIVGNALLHDEEEGYFIFEWSREAVETIVGSSKDVIEQVVNALIEEPSSCGQSFEELMAKCKALIEFLGVIDFDKNRIVEFATA